MLTRKIWHVGTMPVRTGLDTMTLNQILGDIMTDDAYRNDDEKEEKNNEKKVRKRRVWHSRTVHHPRARLSKIYQVKMMAHRMMMMMRRWLSLSRDLASSW